MADQDRLAELERRVARLERMLEARPAAPARPAPAPPAPPPSIAAASMPSPRAAAQLRTSLGRDLEQWVGQRGLLAVGLLALLLTGAYFLKYAIEQGWISPLLRVVGGVVVGAAVAAWGDRVARRGLVAYGGALIGAGGGLAYLATWAAAVPYRLLNPAVGVGALALITIAVFALASRHRVEALGAWAMAGAFAAPFLIPQPQPDVSRFLLYLLLVAGGGGALGFRMRWRGVFALATAGYLLLPIPVFSVSGGPAPFVAHLGAGALVGLLATERRPWPESRLAWLIVGWVSLFFYGGTERVSLAERWELLAVGTAWTLLLAAYHVRSDPFGREDPAEAVAFLTGPVALVLLAWSLGPSLVRNQGGIVPAVLAVGYGASGWPRRVPSRVLMGLALAALAVVGQWDGTAVAIGLGALALAAVATERWGGVRDGQTAGAALAGLALLQLFMVALPARPEAQAAFVGVWALGWYGVTAAAALSAHWWRRDAASPQRLRVGKEFLWALTGIALFAGGSVELDRVFSNRLAGDLAISAYWIVFAGALVQLGFWRESRAVRAAGLGVSVLAALKIVLADLANLEALYRIASVFVLALITLAVAYAYHRRAAA